ncbi:MAG: HEAT repeat domain-containing protein [Gemmatimonadota bacterium]|nr:HEAT repeat domain-containing protein [Gemmatimonadota bacterium]
MHTPTTRSPTPTSVPQAEVREPPPFAASIVDDLLRNLARTVKTRQLYLPNNPIYQRSLDSLRIAFENLWRETEEVVLSIGESDFRWEGVSVGAEPNRGDSLAWLYYKDGVREITVHKGFEGEELVALLDLLQRVRKASPDEDDLLTLLWEQDFLYLRYRFIDMGYEAAPEIEQPEQLTEERSIPPEEVLPEEERPKIVRMEDFDSTLYFLDEQEIEYLRSSFQNEYRNDLKKNVLAILFDTFEIETSTKIRDEIGDILESTMLQLVSAREFGTVAYILREARISAGRAASLEAEHRERLQRLPDRLSVPDVLAHLLALLDESPDIPPQEDLDALFEQLRPGTMQLVFSWIGKLQNPRLRTALEQAASRLAAANTAELLKLVLHTDPAIAIQAIKRAGQLRTPAAVAPIGRILAIPSPVLRLAAVHALAEIGSPGAIRMVEQAITDDERDVRVAAVRAIGARGHTAALSKIEALVRGKELREKDLTEKMALFETYATLAGPAGAAALDGLLNARGKFFAKKEDPEVRACAAMALGRIGSDDAVDALKRATQDKELLVRNAANRALRGGAT